MAEVKAVAWLVNDSAFTHESEAVEEIMTWGPSGSIAEPLIKQAVHESALAALREEVERLKQLVAAGKGELPSRAVAWLDMEAGEASLVFNKKTDSNRASKKRAMELFAKVAPGFYPLYLEPQPDRAARLEAENARLREALRWYADPGIYKPHPHGPAFDNRDLSFHARAALAEKEDKP